MFYYSRGCLRILTKGIECYLKFEISSESLFLIKDRYLSETFDFFTVIFYQNRSQEN